MKELSTQIDVNAPAERVRQIRTDFTAYPSWNPCIRGAYRLTLEPATTNTVNGDPSVRR